MRFENQSVSIYLKRPDVADSLFGHRERSKYYVAGTSGGLAHVADLLACGVKVVPPPILPK